ncbi:MAG: hypothetical protein WA876_14085 [Candidatus Acidiferrales bacterium]
MAYIASKNPWYAFFFGLRGLLRLFVIILALAYAIFVCAALGIGDGGRFLPRFAEAASIAAGRTEIITLVTRLFSIALWFGLHSSIEPGRWGFYQMFSDECEDYDWWGRRVTDRRR